MEDEGKLAFFSFISIRFRDETGATSKFSFSQEGYNYFRTGEGKRKVNITDFRS